MSKFDDWLKTSSDEETLRFAETLARVFLARAGGAGAQLTDLLNCRDWVGILDYTPPMVGVTPDQYYNVAQAQAMFSKLESLPTGIDKEAAALTKFLDGERRCGIFNRIFESRARGAMTFAPRVEAVLHGSARKIAEILGDCPPIKEAPLRFSVGGATTKTKKMDADLRELIAGCVQMSEELASDLPKLDALLSTLPHVFPEWGIDGSTDIEIASGRLSFVLKNAKTKRGITVEPPLNKLVQNGYGDIMRNRLKRHGCDLQNSERQIELARVGSLYNRIATVDLSNASGLICNGLVLDQVPEDWLDIFYWSRTGTIYSEELGEIQLQSFAGMGNGITFPLESLLFWAIAMSVCDVEAIRFPVASIYGDDICISSEAIPLLYETLEAIGLQVNVNKSFVDGPFREACGGDWYLGYDVRPIYLRDNVSSELLYSLHNQFVLRHDEEVCDIIRRHIFYTLGHVPIRGPQGLGDGHLWVDSWEQHAVRRPNMSGWYFDTYRLRPKVRFVVTAFDHVVPLALTDSGNRHQLLCTTEQSIKMELQCARVGDLLSNLTKLNQLSRKREANRPLAVGSPYTRINHWLRNELRQFALSFEEAAVATAQQTAKLRRKRGWNVRYHAVSKPDPDITVFGTPLPGHSGVDRSTLYILG